MQGEIKRRFMLIFLWKKKGWLSCTDPDLLRRICDVLEYYYDSGQFTHTLAYLERYWVDAFDFYRKLADFFRRCGYDRERPL